MWRSEGPQTLLCRVVAPSLKSSCPSDLPILGACDTAASSCRERSAASRLNSVTRKHLCLVSYCCLNSQLALGQHCGYLQPGGQTALARYMGCAQIGHSQETDLR